MRNWKLKCKMVPYTITQKTMTYFDINLTRNISSKVPVIDEGNQVRITQID